MFSTTSILYVVKDMLDLIRPYASHITAALLSIVLFIKFPVYCLAILAILSIGYTHYARNNRPQYPETSTVINCDNPCVKATVNGESTYIFIDVTSNTHKKSLPLLMVTHTDDETSTLGLQKLETIHMSTVSTEVGETTMVKLKPPIDVNIGTHGTKLRYANSLSPPRDEAESGKMAKALCLDLRDFGTDAALTWSKGEDGTISTTLTHSTRDLLSATTPVFVLVSKETGLRTLALQNEFGDILVCDSAASGEVCVGSPRGVPEGMIHIPLLPMCDAVTLDTPLSCLETMFDIQDSDRWAFEDAISVARVCIKPKWRMSVAFDTREGGTTALRASFQPPLPDNLILSSVRYATHRFSFGAITM